MMIMQAEQDPYLCARTIHGFVIPVNAKLKQCVGENTPGTAYPVDHHEHRGTAKVFTPK